MASCPVERSVGSHPISKFCLIDRLILIILKADDDPTLEDKMSIKAEFPTIAIVPNDSPRFSMR